MAVQMIGAIKRYTGTAAEIGNFSLVGVPVGSTFFESDTGQLKILSAAGTLVNAPSESVTLSGSIPEYGWVNGDTEPEPDRFAFGVKVDPTTGNITCMYWNGTAWKAVV